MPKLESGLFWSSNVFQAAFCKAFFCSPIFVTLGSNLVLLGDEALEPFLELGLEPVLDPVLDAGLVPFNFFPEPIRFFFLVPSTTFDDFTREFCLLSFPGTDCVCLGEMAFLGNLDKGLT